MFKFGGNRLSSSKIISIFLFVLLTVFLFLQPILAKEATIDEDNLNVRSGPSTDHDLLGQVNSGEQYEILEEDAEWVKIQFDDSSGWVTKEFITINDDNPSKTEEERTSSSLETVTIQYDHTQLREGPSTDYDITSFTDKGKVFDVVSESDNWLEITDDETTAFVLRDLVEQQKNKNQVNGLENKTIVIDAGHGGRDVGAIGFSGSYEKDITYLTAHELEKELVSLGANVILTRSENEYIPLEARSTLANVVDTDAFLSLHYNSFPEAPSATGIETFYYHEQFEPLASFIHEGIIKETEERDRGVSAGDFHVIRQNFKPGALLELGFLSNEQSDSLLQSTAYQKKIVLGIVNGLQKYFASEEN